MVEMGPLLVMESTVLTAIASTAQSVALNLFVSNVLFFVYRLTWTVI